eukprot:4656678-Pyramimonas_sp.AAC.1
MAPALAIDRSGSSGWRGRLAQLRKHAYQGGRKEPEKSRVKFDPVYSNFNVYSFATQALCVLVWQRL